MGKKTDIWFFISAPDKPQGRVAAPLVSPSSALPADTRSTGVRPKIYYRIYLSAIPLIFPLPRLSAFPIHNPHPLFSIMALSLRSPPVVHTDLPSILLVLGQIPGLLDNRALCFKRPGVVRHIKCQSTSAFNVWTATPSCPVTNDCRDSASRRAHLFIG